MTKGAKSIGLLLAGLTAMMTLGACSGSSGSASANSAGKLAPAERAAAPSAAQLPASAHDATGSAARTKTQPAAGSNALVDTSAKIRTAWMTVDVRGSGNVAAKADTADTIAESVGGEIDSDDRTSGRHATATLRLRVPPAELQTVLDRLGNLGGEKSRRSSTTDVTEQVADVASRVRSAQAAISQLRALYRHAGKVGDLLSVENELTTREANLEALQAQQRSLARQTALATVTLSLRTATTKHHAATHHNSKRTGFVGGLARGWDGFVTAAVWVASAFATVLPFLVLLVLVALGLRAFGVRTRISRIHQS